MSRIFLYFMIQLVLVLALVGLIIALRLQITRGYVEWMGKHYVKGKDLFYSMQLWGRIIAIPVIIILMFLLLPQNLG